MSRRAYVPNIASARGTPVPRRSERRASSFKTCDAGFHGVTTPTASSHLSNAVAATIAVGTLSLCAGVTLAVLAIKASMALPIPT
ncbi:hypothetical protein [Bradyrhizobium sp. STM 3557]|jgi:hypothetical protein|uniref:hypothetical protein n=1 Tax=Bradyrhizobium sp. STM 3557 TaxID=578920 RepID=UPI00388DDF2B